MMKIIMKFFIVQLQKWTKKFNNFQETLIIPIINKVLEKNTCDRSSQWYLPPLWKSVFFFCDTWSPFFKKYAKTIFTIIFPDRTKLKIASIKIITFFKRRVSIILWYFSS